MNKACERLHPIAKGSQSMKRGAMYTDVIRCVAISMMSRLYALVGFTASYDSSWAYRYDLQGLASLASTIKDGKQKQGSTEAGSSLSASNKSNSDQQYLDSSEILQRLLDILQRQLPGQQMPQLGSAWCRYFTAILKAINSYLLQVCPVLALLDGIWNWAYASASQVWWFVLLIWKQKLAKGLILFQSPALNTKVDGFERASDQ